MKKIVFFLTFALILCMLAACAKDGNDTTREDVSDSEQTTAPAETEPHDPFLDSTFGKDGDKTVREQRSEIKEAMDLAINTEVVYKEIPEFNPTLDLFSSIKAITYEAFEYQGQKTKVFAYIGFPENASAENPVPAVVLIHGGGGHPYLNWVKHWTNLGYAAIAMETTGYFPSVCNAGVDETENSKFTYGMHGIFLEEGYTNAPDRSYVTEYTEVEDQWAYHGLTQVILAHNILRQDERVDNDNIGVVGISWGGVMASQVIGYDNRFSFAIPVYGTAYLGDEMRPFDLFADPYVDALWAAERTLDNADMPTYWLVYSDDGNFGVPSYCKSYLHTEGLNDKNALTMLSSWGHSHNSVIGVDYTYLYADWITFNKGGIITVIEQPNGREINCKINIPDADLGSVTASLVYIDAPMSYSEHSRNGGSPRLWLDQTWKTDSKCLTVNLEEGTITGTAPEDARGYYIQIYYSSQGKRMSTTSVYTAIEE